MLKKLLYVERIIIYLALFLTPLVPALLDRGFEESKVLVLLYLLLPAVVLFLLKRTINAEKLKLTPVVLLTAVFVLVLALTSLTGIDSTRSFFGEQPYFQGVILFLFFFFLTLTVSQSHFSPKHVAVVILSANVLVALVAIDQFSQRVLGIPIPTYSGRVVSTFGQPNFYSGFLLLSLPLWLYLWRQKKGIENYFLLVLLIPIIAAIAISFSKSAIVLTGLFFSLLLVGKIIRTKRMRIMFLIATIILFTAGLFLTGTIQKELIDPITKQTVIDGNVEKRIYIWQVTLEVIAKKPILGYGLENIYPAFPKDFDFNHPKPAFYHAIRNLNIDRTHNIFLDLLVVSGVVGLISFIGLMLFILFKTKTTYIKIAVILFLFWSMIQNLSVMHWLLFFLYLGLIRQKSVDTDKLNKVL